MKVPVLTYHASRVAGNDYISNDHVALKQDLKLLGEQGWRVVPLQWVVNQRVGLKQHDLERCVALSCDDGCDLEVRDVDYPEHGFQESFLNIMIAMQAQFPLFKDMHMTSFVIADPNARAKMDVQCLHGRDWLQETWWKLMSASKNLSIECHGWDHNHPVIDTLGPEGMQRGDFFQVNTHARAEFQIDQAVSYINQRIAPHQCGLFAYPYGHVPDYLVGEYLPQNTDRLGLKAAFSTDGQPATMHSDIWNLPRFVCGYHWKSTGQLQQILDQCV
jgi:Polysaccharide deacetylase